MNVCIALQYLKLYENWVQWKRGLLWNNGSDYHDHSSIRQDLLTTVLFLLSSIYLQYQCSYSPAFLYNISVPIQLHLLTNQCFYSSTFTYNINVPIHHHFLTILVVEFSIIYLQYQCFYSALFPYNISGFIQHHLLAI